MDKIQDTLNRLNSGNMSVAEIHRCLGSNNILVKSNAILAIIRTGLFDDNVLNTLYGIAQNINNESSVFGLWNSGHFAVAALKLLNTRDSLNKYREVMSHLSSVQAEDIGRLQKEWSLTI